MGVEPVLIRIVVVNNGKGGVKHVHTKRVVEFRDRSPPGWPLLWAQVEECARCAVLVGGLRRISGRDELAGVVVGGAKHVHAKRVVEIRNGSPHGWPLLWAQVEECARCAVRVGGLRRISGRDELASAAVGVAKHVHAKRVVEFCDG